MTRAMIAGLALAALVSSSGCGDVDSTEPEPELQQAVLYGSYYSRYRLYTNIPGTPYLEGQACEIVTGKFYPNRHFLWSQTPSTVIRCPVSWDRTFETVRLATIWYNQPYGAGFGAACQLRFKYSATGQIVNQQPFVLSTKNAPENYDDSNVTLARSDNGLWMSKGTVETGRRQPLKEDLELLCNVMPTADLYDVEIFYKDTNGRP